MNKAPHDTEQQPLPEFFPTIIVDANLGKYVDSFDVDITKLASTFEEAAMTPEQIEETRVIFDAKRDKKGKAEAIGRLANDTDIIVNPVSYIDYATRRHNELTDDAYLRGRFRQAMPSNEISETLRHEAEHRIVVTEGGMPEEARHIKRVQRKLTAAALLPTFVGAPFAFLTKESYMPSQSLGELTATIVGCGSIAMTAALVVPRKIIKKAYRENPEENRAFDTQTPECWGLVSLTLKASNLKDANQETDAV